MWMPYNPNPKANRVIDCTVRAISKVLNQDWDTTFIDLCLHGFMMKDMPSSNNVWGRYLRANGFRRHLIDQLDDCYSVRDFADDHPYGKYVLALNSHVVAVVDGDYYDTWDSGQEIPIYYWEVKHNVQPVSSVSAI